MIELPEAKTLENQSNGALIGKKIKKVYEGTSQHKFCWFNGESKDYDGLLKNREIISAYGHGMFLDLHLNGATLTINDGTNIRYFESIIGAPKKHQLLIEFEDESALVFTVAMYGGIFAYQGEFNNEYHSGSLNSIFPLSDDFNENHFEFLMKSCKKDLSAKAFLATQQRIPGLGNGCLQDVLLTSAIHPKRKMSTLSDSEKSDLLYSVKAVLTDMTAKGGRDTERDLFGNPGGYKTMLSKNNKTCLLCGDRIIKEAYLGGSIYYCPTCQKLSLKE